MQRAVHAILVAALVLTAVGAARAASWTEVGDAGNELSPQATLGIGDLTEIHGTIGDPDFRDAFLFAYDGTPGQLHITSLWDAGGPLTGPTGVLLLDTDTGGTLLAPFDIEVTVNDLASGLYVVMVALDDDGADPPYTIRFDGPGESGGAGFSSVPEPDTLALAGLGLCALAGFGPRRKNALPRTRT